MNLLDKISRSNTTLIGYDSRNEFSVEKLLNFLPSVSLFRNVSNAKVIEYFNSLSYSRDYKLSSLLCEDKVSFIVIDIGSIFFEKDILGTMSRSQYTKKFITEIQSSFYSISNTDSPIKFKLIILTQLVNILPMNKTLEFKGGSLLLHIADLVVKFSGEMVSIEKDRESVEKSVNTVKSELREISIKLLFDDITTTT